MPEHIESMPILPIRQILRDADDAWKIQEGTHGDHYYRKDLWGDLACHIRALVAALEKATEACAVAYDHMDNYGVVRRGDEEEVNSRERVFEALGPFVRVDGLRTVSVYR